MHSIKIHIIAQTKANMQLVFIFTIQKQKERLFFSKLSSYYKMDYPPIIILKWSHFSVDGTLYMTWQGLNHFNRTISSQRIIQKHVNSVQIFFFLARIRKYILFLYCDIVNHFQCLHGHDVTITGGYHEVFRTVPTIYLQF